MDINLNDLTHAVRLISNLIDIWVERERAFLASLPVDQPIGEGAAFSHRLTDGQLADAIDLHDRLLALLPEEML